MNLRDKIPKGPIRQRFSKSKTGSVTTYTAKQLRVLDVRDEEDANYRIEGDVGEWVLHAETLKINGIAVATEELNVAGQGKVMVEAYDVVEGKPDWARHINILIPSTATEYKNWGRYNEPAR